MRETTMRPAHASRRHGFTIVELVIVLTLMGLIVGIAGARLDLGKYRTNSGVTVLMTTIQGAQRLAVQRQYQVIVSFDTATARVRTIEDADSNGRVSAGDHVVWKSLGDQVKFAVPPRTIGGASATASISDPTGGTIRELDGYPTILMRRDGSSSDNVEMFIRTTRQQLTDFRALAVTQSTGRIDIYRFSPPTTWVR